MKDVILVFSKDEIFTRNLNNLLERRGFEVFSTNQFFKLRDRFDELTNDRALPNPKIAVLDCGSFGEESTTKNLFWLRVLGNMINNKPGMKLVVVSAHTEAELEKFYKHASLGDINKLGAHILYRDYEIVGAHIMTIRP